MIFKYFLTEHIKFFCAEQCAEQCAELYAVVVLPLQWRTIPRRFPQTEFWTESPSIN